VEALHRFVKMRGGIKCEVNEYQDGNFVAVYKGCPAKLKMVGRDKVSSKPGARAWVSAKTAEPERILSLLQVCNPNFPTGIWRVGRVEKAVGLQTQNL